MWFANVLPWIQCLDLLGDGWAKVWDFFLPSPSGRWMPHSCIHYLKMKHQSRNSLGCQNYFITCIKQHSICQLASVRPITLIIVAETHLNMAPSLLKTSGLPRVRVSNHTWDGHRAPWLLASWPSGCRGVAAGLPYDSLQWLYRWPNGWFLFSFSILSWFRESQLWFIIPGWYSNHKNI